MIQIIAVGSKLPHPRGTYYSYSYMENASNVFSSETKELISGKFHMEPQWLGGTKVCPPNLGHTTTMAALPNYGKKIKKVFSGTPVVWYAVLGI